MQYEAERGYLILGTEQYIECAETLASSLRYWHPDVKICLLTDVEYTNTIFDAKQSIIHYAFSDMSFVLFRK